MKMTDYEKMFIEQKAEEIKDFCDRLIPDDGEPHLGLEDWAQPSTRSGMVAMVLAAKLMQFYRCTDRNTQSEELGRLCQNILNHAE